MKNDFIIKVCGMRDPFNIDELCSIRPGYIGFIFYPPSKRYVKDITDGQALSFIPKNIKRTGVFVNTRIAEILKVKDEYGLSVAQLHGNESPEYCREVKSLDLEVFKAFAIEEGFDFKQLEAYKDICDFFLFDTKTEGHGGSGKKFGWDILKNYQMDKPFLLSGGIGPEDALAIKEINHKQLAGIDINSRFEDAPAVKNIAKIRKFLGELFE